MYKYIYIISLLIDDSIRIYIFVLLNPNIKHLFKIDIFYILMFNIRIDILKFF